VCGRQEGACTRCPASLCSVKGRASTQLLLRYYLLGAGAYDRFDTRRRPAHDSFGVFRDPITPLVRNAS